MGGKALTMAAPRGEPPSGHCFHFWKKGACSFGERCKYIHELTPPPARPAANPAPGGPGGGAGGAGSGGGRDASAGGGSIVSATLVPAQAPVPAFQVTTPRIGEPPKGVCFDTWFTGVCKRVDCTYVHQTDSAPVPARAPPIAQQPAAAGGGAGLSVAQTSGAPLPPQTSVSAFPAAPGHVQAPAHTPAHTRAHDTAARPRVGEPPRGVCYDMWRTGVCKWGVSCTYSHPIDPPRALPPTEQQPPSMPPPTVMHQAPLAAPTSTVGNKEHTATWRGGGGCPVENGAGGGAGGGGVGGAEVDMVEELKTLENFR